MDMNPWDMNPNYLGLLLPKMLCELFLFVVLIVDGIFDLVSCFPKKVWHDALTIVYKNIILWSHSSHMGASWCIIFSVQEYMYMKFSFSQ